MYNYSFHSITWGWRLSVALGGVFAAMVSLGAMLLPDTPPSLLSRGHPEKARRVSHHLIRTRCLMFPCCRPRPVLYAATVLSAARAGA